MHADWMTRLPDPRQVHSLLRQYVRVPLQADTTHIDEGDRVALTKLVDAARLIEPIYWRQRSDFGWSLAQGLHRSPKYAGGELDRLLTINYGPWDNLNGDAPFWGDTKVPPGANFYPADLDRQELDAYLTNHPDEAEAL